MKPTTLKLKTQGFTLVEFMIAITISAIILGVLSQVYVGAKSTYRSQEALARMQENSRYAVDLLARDMRLAGYMGCIGSTASINNIANPVTGWTPLNTTTSPPSVEGVFGYEQADLPTAVTTFPLIDAEVKANTDVVQIQHLSLASAKLTNPGPQNANMQIAGNPLNFQQYEILVVTDCTWADIFKATSVSNASGTVTIAHSNNNNTGNNTNGRYGENAEVMRFEANAYFVGSGSSTNYCPANTLCRKRLGSYLTIDPGKWCTNASASTSQGFCQEQIAEGVEDLQLEYGIDTDGDLSADRFVPASSITTNNCGTNSVCWPNVVSMRLNLLVRSVATNVSPQVQSTYPASQIPLLNGAAPTITDRAYRRVYTETIVLRNRAL